MAQWLPRLGCHRPVKRKTSRMRMLAGPPASVPPPKRERRLLLPSQPCCENALTLGRRAPRVEASPVPSRCLYLRTCVTACTHASLGAAPRRSRRSPVSMDRETLSVSIGERSCVWGCRPLLTLGN